MKTAIIFPGQGAQSVGMGKDMYESNDVYRDTFDKLDATLDFSLKQACFEGYEKSEYVQPAIYAHSISLFKAMGIKADVYAGLSLGEYSALAAGGVVDENGCASLVNKRGAIMDGAVESGTCGMVSAIGLKMDAVSEIADSIDDIWVANYISELQIVLAGKIAAVDKACEKIEAKDAKAIKLNTAGPFHSPMLKSASEEFKSLFSKVDIGQKSAIIYSNYTGLPYEDDADYSDLLANQMCSLVKWYDVCEHMIASGVTNIIEVGPGMVLSKVLKRRVKGLDINISSVRDAKTFGKFMAKQ